MTDSPCVGICIMEGGYCIGCGRSEEEIYQAGADLPREEGQQADGFRVIPTPVPPAPGK